jgi:hypothetical protein
VAVTYRKWKKARVETEWEWKCGAHMILTCMLVVLLMGVAVTAVVAGPTSSFCFRDRSTNRAAALLFFRWRALRLLAPFLPRVCIPSFLLGGGKAVLDSWWPVRYTTSDMLGKSLAY